MKNIAYKELLKPEEGAELYGMSKGYFVQWANSVGARVKLSDRMIRYERRVIDEAIENARVKSAPVAEAEE